LVVAYNLVRGARVEHAEPRKTVSELKHVVDKIVVIRRWPTAFESLSKSRDHGLGKRLALAVSQLAGKSIGFIALDVQRHGVEFFPLVLLSTSRSGGLRKWLGSMLGNLARNCDERRRPVERDWERLAPFDEQDTTEVVLEPGDLLILPAGIWHEACGGEGGSLALYLSFAPISYTLLVRNLLDSLLTPEPGWRSPAPVLPIGSAG
jgi:hypothetical protein